MHPRTFRKHLVFSIGLALSRSRSLLRGIPMRFQNRGGRKRIVAPDGSAIVLSAEPQPDGMLVKELASAWRWQKLLDVGLYTAITEMGTPRRSRRVT
jgi:hypothetical protein